MKKMMLGTVVAVAFALTGCGGSRCDAKSKCSADPVPTAEQIQMCKDGAKLPDGGTPKCTTEANALADCMSANQVCGADNKTDGAATLAKCTSQQMAFNTCFMSM